MPLSLHPTDLRRGLLLVFCLMVFQSARHGKNLLASPFLTNPRRPWQLLGLFYFAALLSVIAQIYAYRVPMYDTGIFHQSIWHASQGNGFYTSISGSGDHMQDHFSWSFALLVPFMKLTGGALWVLPFAHVTLIFGGFSVWVWFAKSLDSDGKNQENLLPLGIALLACFSDSVWQNIWWGFHETSFCFLAWSWFIALQWRPASPARQTKRHLDLVALLFIGAFSKETALVEATGLALVSGLFSFKRRESVGKITSWLLIAVLFIVILYLFEIQPKPADKNYFERYYSYLGRNVHDAVFALISDPFRPIRVLGWSSFTHFGIELLWPWLGLPFYWMYQKKNLRTLNWLWFVAFIPGIGLLMLSTDRSLRGSEYHYVLSIWPVVAIASIAAIKSLQKQWILPVLVMLACWNQSKDVMENTRLSLGDIARYGVGAPPTDGIPENAKISASERAGPWLSHFHFVTRWPELSFFSGQCPDYVFIHSEYNAAPSENPHCFQTILDTKRNGPWTRYHLASQSHN